MKIVWCISILTFLLFSCKNKIAENVALPITIDTSEYGSSYSKYDTNNVEIAIADYTDYKSLLEHIYHVNCESKHPNLQFESSNGFKKIYPINTCPWIISCQSKSNYILVTKDSIFKDNSSYPMDSLRLVMQMDYDNRGKKAGWSKDPSDVFLLLRLGKDDLLSLIPLLDLITASYDELKTTSSLKSG